MDPNNPDNLNNQPVAESTPVPEPTPEVEPAPQSEPVLEPTPEPAPEPNPAPESTPESASTPEPAPESNPEPTPSPEPTPEPTPEPAPEPAPAPNPTPEPTLTPSSDPAPKSKKLKPGLVALIICLIFFLGVGGTFLGLVAGGVIKLGPAGNGISGIFSGGPTVPDVEKIQSVCADYGGTFKQQDDQKMDSETGIYATPYLCEGSDGYIFSVMIFNTNLLDILNGYKERYADQIANSSEAQQIDLDSVSTFVKFLILTDSMEMTDIENSPNYYKATLENKPSSDDQPSMTWYRKAYVVAYDNVIITSMINDDASSEAVLTALGANK